MGKYLQICVLFQAVTVLYSASISQLLRRPQNPPKLEDAVIVKLYNERLSNSSSLYKLLEVGSHGQTLSLPPVAPQDKSFRGHHQAKFIDSGTKNETTSLDVMSKDSMGSHLAASCLMCMFEDLPRHAKK